MSQKYGEMTRKIFEAVGKKDNIVNISHCATRLRLTLKENKPEFENKVKAISGVLGTVSKGNDFQIIIGTEVTQVYNEFVEMNGAVENTGSIERIDSTDCQETGGTRKKKNVAAQILDFIPEIFAPILPVLVAGGLIASLLTLFTVFFNLDTESGTYIIFSAINNAAFYFLPIYVGYTTAKRLHIEPMLGAFLGAILVHSSINGAEGLSFLGIPVSTVTYSSSVIPVILGTVFMSYIYKFFSKILVKEIKFFALPLITMVITAPVTLIALGPLGDWCGQGLAFVLQIMYEHVGWLAVGVIGCLTPVLVMTGMNHALSPIVFAMFATFNCDPFELPGMLAGNVAVGAAALAVWFKSKDADTKGLAFSAGITGVLGITEPSIYGVLVKYRKAFIGAMVGGLVGGIFAGLTNVAEYAIVSPGLAAFLAFVNPDGTMGNLIFYFLTIVISCATAFIATLVLDYKKDTIK